MSEEQDMQEQVGNTEMAMNEKERGIVNRALSNTDQNKDDRTRAIIGHSKMEEDYTHMKAAIGKGHVEVRGKRTKEVVVSANAASFCSVMLKEELKKNVELMKEGKEEGAGVYKRRYWSYMLLKG